MKVLLDANVLIAAVASQGVCHLVVELCVAEHELIVSQELLDVVGTKLPKRLKVPPADVHPLLSYYRQGADLVIPHKVDKEECRDPKDLHVLGAAMAGRADVIVTGDADRLVLSTFKGIPIKSPRSFIRPSGAKAPSGAPSTKWGRNTPIFPVCGRENCCKTVTTS